ncbi:MAG: hypothetical protein PUP46_07620 [Endozoicomonas sp. (ex Botrylloides leachii)]|nr:hypothetical protein [Endozoicomonas sp. (ex Botrylloides leachii)]
MECTSSIITALTSILSALIGGLITGFFTLRAVKSTFENQKKQSNKEEKKITSSLLQGIHDELETIGEGYKKQIGSKLDELEDNEPMLDYAPLSGDYFPIYNGNTLIIGRIQDNNLRKNIIKTYHIGTSMIDSIKMNNYIISKYEHACILYNSANTEVNKHHRDAYYAVLIKYASLLKEGHQMLLDSITTTLDEIKKTLEH